VPHQVVMFSFCGEIRWFPSEIQRYFQEPIIELYQFDLKCGRTSVEEHMATDQLAEGSRSM